MQNIHSSLNSEVTSKHKVKKIAIQPQIKSGNMLKKMCFIIRGQFPHNKVKVSGIALQTYYEMVNSLKERKHVSLK